MNNETGRQPTDGASNEPGRGDTGAHEDQGNPATQQMRAVGRRRREAEDKLRQAVEGKADRKDESSEDAAEDAGEDDTEGASEEQRDSDQPG